MKDKKPKALLVFLFVPFPSIFIISFIFGISLVQMVVMILLWAIAVISFFNFAILVILYDKLLPDKMNMER